MSRDDIVDLLPPPSHGIPWGSSPYAGSAPLLPETLCFGGVDICARELRFQRNRQTNFLPH